MPILWVHNRNQELGRKAAVKSPFLEKGALAFFSTSTSKSKISRPSTFPNITIYYSSRFSGLERNWNFRPFFFPSPFPFSRDSFLWTSFFHSSSIYNSIQELFSSHSKHTISKNPFSLFSIPKTHIQTWKRPRVLFSILSSFLFFFFLFLGFDVLFDFLCSFLLAILFGCLLDFMQRAIVWRKSGVGNLMWVVSY